MIAENFEKFKMEKRWKLPDLVSNYIPTETCSKIPNSFIPPYFGRKNFRLIYGLYFGSEKIFPTLVFFYNFQLKVIFLTLILNNL